MRACQLRQEPLQMRVAPKQWRLIETKPANAVELLVIEFEHALTVGTNRVPERDISVASRAAHRLRDTHHQRQLRRFAELEPEFLP